MRKIFGISLILFLILSTLTNFLNIGNSNLLNRIFIKTYNQILDKEKKVVDKINLQEKQVVDKINLQEKNIFNTLNFFSEDHHGHAILSIYLYKKNYIFGVGPKGFRHYCRKVNYDPPKGICSTHPHNFLLQFAAELGLLGLIFYFAALYFLVKNLFTFNKRKNQYFSFVIISIGLLINLFPFLPSGNFFNNWISIMIYYKLGLYLYTYQFRNL